MNYKGYDIERDKGYYTVTGSKETWSEDTVEDAKAIIDSIEEEDDASVSYKV